MEESERMADFFTRIITHTNTMKSCGEKMEDAAIVEKILRTMTPKFDHVVVAIEESGRVDKIKTEELQGSLEAHEQRINERMVDEPSHQALQTQTGARKGSFYVKNFNKNQGKGSDSKYDSMRLVDQHEHSNRRSNCKQSKGWKRIFDKRKVRCVNCGGLPHYLWSEAISTATYVLNICPTQSLNDQVPEEVWTGRRPSVKHLRVFGSMCYKHILDQIRTKLNDNSELMIFVGYHPIGSYKLLNPTTNQVMFSRDVHFEEMSSWIDLLKIIEQKKTIPLVPTLDEHDVLDEVNYTPRQIVINVVATRSTRIRQSPMRLNEYELFPDDAITEEGDLIHLALIGETKPITFQQVIEEYFWFSAM
ncbi:PREDICTED: uncharacterized protein LOC109333984 [Lupinus angustifolius]|uniref:uncharacterized protein LOC109333984 n=1 Tax=Lupinus angustifolius TaxID=3871 RepID=UPI00092F3E90|nr:PREDICTED: uncharacterized protein LOC109333984 [Lupinus angustifolius]